MDRAEKMDCEANGKVGFKGIQIWGRSVSDRMKELMVTIRSRFISTGFVSTVYMKS